MGGEKSDGAGKKKDYAENVPSPGSPAGSRRFFTIAALVLIVLVLALAAAVIVFKGNDGPGSKIDYSGMNAVEDPSNSAPVAGHPDLYVRSVDAMFENGTTLKITENRTAADTSYDHLIAFLDSTKISREPYQTGHVCSSFAAELHDAAEMAGIRAHLVVIFFDDAPQHLIVAFKTTDKGLVYVDATGRTLYEINAGYPPTYRIADVVPGQPYVRHYPEPYEHFNESASMGIVGHVRFIS
jgi:hypothetical protein